MDADKKSIDLQVPDSISSLKEENEILELELKRYDVLLQSVRNERDDANSKFAIISEQLSSITDGEESIDEEDKSSLSASELLKELFSLKDENRKLKLDLKQHLQMHETVQASQVQHIENVHLKMQKYKKRYDELEKDLSERKNELVCEADSIQLNLNSTSMDLETALQCLQEEQKSSKELQNINKLLREQLGEATDANKALTDEIYNLTSDYESTKHFIDCKNEQWLGEEESYKTYFSNEHNNILRLLKHVKLFKDDYRNVKSATQHDLSIMKSEISYLSRKMSSACFQLMANVSSNIKHSSTAEEIKDSIDSFLKHHMYTEEKHEHFGRIQQISTENERLLSLVVAKESLIETLRTTIDNQENRMNTEYQKFSEKSQILNETQELLIVYQNSMKSVAQLVLNDLEQSTLNQGTDQMRFSHSTPNSSFLGINSSVINLSSSIIERSQSRCFVESTVSTVTKTLNGKRLHIQDLQSKLDSSQMDLIELRDSFMTKDAEYRELVRNNTELSLEIDTLKANISTIQSEKDQLERSLNDSRTEISALADTENMLNNQISILDSEKKNLQDKYTDKTYLSNELRRDFEKLKQHNSDLSCENRNRKEQVLCVENKLKCLQVELSTLKDKLYSKELLIESLEQENQKLKSSVNTSEKQYTEAEKEISNLQKEKFQLKDEVGKLEINRDFSNQDLNNLNNNIIKLQQEISLLKRDKQDMMEKIKQFQDDVCKKEEENKDFQSKIFMLNKELAYVNAEIENANKELSVTSSEKLKMDSDFQSLKHQNKSLNDRLDKVTTDLQEERKSIKIVQNNRDVLLKENCEIKHQIEELEREKKSLHISVTKLETEKRDLEVMLSEESTKNGSLLDKFTNMENDYDNIIQKHDKLHGEVVVLNTKIEVKVNQIEKLKEESSRKLNEIKLENENSINQIVMAHESKLQELQYKDQSLSSVETSYRQQIDLFQSEKQEVEFKQNKIIEELENKYQNMETDYKHKLQSMEKEKQGKVQLLMKEKDDLEVLLRSKETDFDGLQNNFERYKVQCEAKNKQNTSKIFNLEQDIANKITENHSIVSKHDNELKQVREKIAHLNSDKKSLEECVMAKEKELENFKVNESIREENVEDLKKNIEELTSLKNTLNVNYDHTKTELDTVQHGYSLCDQNINNLKDRLSTSEKERNDNLNLLTASEQKVTALEKSKTELLKESYELRDTLRDVETSRLKLKKEMCRIKDRFDIAQAEIKNLNNELSQVLSLRKQDHIREESTQKEIVELKQKLIEKEAFCEASKKEIKNLDQKLISNQTDCKIKFQSLEYALDESQKSEHRVDSDRRYLENQLQSVTEEVATLKMHLNSAEGEINGLKNYLSPLEVSKQKLEVELTEFRSAVRSTLGSTLQKTINLSDLQEISPNILHLSLQDLVQQLRSTETQKEKSIIQVKELQKQLHELDQEKNKSLMQLSAVKQSMNTIQQDKDKMSYKLQAAKSALVSLEQVIKSLKSEKSVLYKKITEMESKTSSVNTLNHHQEGTIQKLKDLEIKLGNEVSNQKLALSKAEALITELQMMKVSLEEEVMYFKGSVNDRITENEVMKERICAMNKQMADLEERDISLQVSVDRLNLALNKSSEGQSQLKHQVINLNRSLSEKSSSTTHLNVRIRELQSSLKSSEEDRLLIQSRLDNSKKKVNEIDQEKRHSANEMAQLQAEIKSKNSRMKDLESEKWSLQKIINDQHENEQNQLSKIRNLLAEKKILQEKCLETQNELQHTEWDKKLAQKSQSKLEKDKNILKKTLHKVEQEKLATEKVPLSDELEKLELKHENQNLKAKIMENEQMQVQEISNITMRYRQEIDLSNERIKKFHSNSEKLFETREEAHRQKILRLEGEIRILRQQMQEDAHKRRTYIMKSLEAGKEAKELRKTLHSSLNNISTLDSVKLDKEIYRLDKTVNHHLNLSNISSIKTPSPPRLSNSKSRTTSPMVASHLLTSTPSMKSSRPRSSRKLV